MRSVGFLALLLLCDARGGAPSQAPVDVTGVVAVTDALARDSGRATLAHVPMQLVRIADPAQFVTFSFRSDGRAAVYAPAGDYRLRSLAPVRVGDTTLGWDVGVTLSAGAYSRVELTRDAAVAWDTLAEARQAAASDLGRLSRSVLQLRAGVFTGTGIYLDTLGGVIEASAHLIGNATRVVVVRAEGGLTAQELARDTTVDLVLLRFAPGACPGCVPLRLGDSAGLVPGDRIAVLAQPPHQMPAVTTGRVTGAAAGTLATTVYPGPPLSGGAILDSADRVAGLMTCACQAEGDSVLPRVTPVGRLKDLFAQGAARVAALSPPPVEPSPLIPEPSLAMEGVRALADTATAKAYERFAGQKARNFAVSLVTPAYLLRGLRQANEVFGRLPAWQAMGPEERLARSSSYALDWITTFGDPLVPAVAIDVTPQSGQPAGEGLLRLVVPGTVTGRFKGDVERVEVFRNATLYQPLADGLIAVRVDFEEGDVRMHDEMHWGYYVLPVDALAPDSLGVPPSIVLRIHDARHSGEVTPYELRGDVVARAWNDFATYFQAIHPDEAFRRADARKFRSRLQDVSSPMPD